jgi:hypothetical protein
VGTPYSFSRSSPSPDQRGIVRATRSSTGTELPKACRVSGRPSCVRMIRYRRGRAGGRPTVERRNLGSSQGAARRVRKSPRERCGLSACRRDRTAGPSERLECGHAILGLRPTAATNFPVLTIDGACFSDFNGFAREFSRLVDGYMWRGNLDAFNDILGGGSGTPDNGWVLRWLNSELSRSALGYEATARRLQQLLRTCHPSYRPAIQAQLLRASANCWARHSSYPDEGACWRRWPVLRIRRARPAGARAPPDPLEWFRWCPAPSG